MTIEQIERPFLGSRSRKLLGEYPTDDKLYRFTLGTPVPFTREDNGKPVASTVVNENFNNVYDYYMGGDIGETIIKTNRPGLPRVLVVGDSFTNPLEGILYTSCDECAVWITVTMTARISSTISQNISLMSCCMSAMI